MKTICALLLSLTLAAAAQDWLANCYFTDKPFSVDTALLLALEPGEKKVFEFFSMVVMRMPHSRPVYSNQNLSSAN